MGSPVNTGNKVGDMGLTLLAAPFNIVKTVAWDGPKSLAKKAGKMTGLKKDDEKKEEPVVDEDDKLTPELNKLFTSPISVEDYFALIPADYRKMGKAPISAFITPAYKKCYEHFLSADKQKAIMDAHPQSWEGRNEIVHQHMSVLMEVLIEYYFDQHFLQILYEDESRFVPEDAPTDPDAKVDFCLVPSPAYQGEFKYITTTVPADGAPTADGSAMKAPCTTTWMAGDIGRSCKNTDQLIAYIRFYQSQLRHAAGRIDREAAVTKFRSAIKDFSEALLNDTDLEVLLREASNSSDGALDKVNPARLSTTSCVIA